MTYQGLEGDVEQKILKMRAHDLAKNSSRESTSQVKSYLVFCLGQDEKYAISYEKIERVRALTTLTSIPGISSFFSGVTYHNARVWPVIDMEALLDISTSDSEDAKTSESLVLLRDGAHGYALSVKHVIGHMQLDVSEAAARPGKKEKTSAYILGVCQSDITIIDDKAIIEFINLMPLGET